ncbi:Neogenin-like [Oopsacas minuta]|uniref:Neogenin-like n=1 Tax=Oopsacas minuta TaxID=111878 RepID=A0AAV7JB67_9METZ|nr:Neogenin-like [Oopsacas minuta]
MLASQYIFNLCCNIELLMIFIAIGTIIGVQGLNNTVLTLMVPPEAYPGGTIDLYCESSTTGLLYRWVDVDSTEIISEDQQYSLTIAESTEVISRTVECQAYISSMVVAKESATFTIVFVSRVTFDIREQDSINPREVVIQCFASATVSRAPKISWFYTSLTEIIQISVSTTGYQQIGNVLTILSTDPASSGVYECSATLDDVASTTKNMSTTVQIYSPPVVSLQQPSNRDVFSPIQYSSFEITCDVTGLDTPMIEWLVNGLPPDPTAVTSNMLVITEPDANSLDVITDVSYIQYSLTISSVQLDLTSVSCLASNHLGSAQVDAQIRVERLGRPCAPLNFILIGHNSYWVELKWNINTNCEEKYFASSYILEYTSRGVALKIEYFLTQGDVRNIEYTYILYHLSPYTAYQIRVSARNEYGTSEYTEYITVVTSPIDKKVIFYYGIENGDSEMEHGYYTQSIALRATTSIPVGNRRIESVYVSPFGAFSLDRRSYSWYPQRFVPYGYIQRKSSAKNLQKLPNTLLYSFIHSFILGENFNSFKKLNTHLHT